MVINDLRGLCKRQMIKLNKTKALKSASKTKGESRSMFISHPTSCKKKKGR